MQKDPNASDKARKAEQRANEKSGLITIKPLKLEGGVKKGGFKKGGFKSAFAPANSVSTISDKTESIKPMPKRPVAQDQDASDDEMVNYELYDPRKPTGCDGTCEDKVD